MTTAATTQAAKGGEWLVAETDPATVTTREGISDEHRLIEQTAAEFMDGEVLPVLDRLEAKDWALNRELVRQVRRARPARHQRAGELRRRRPRQGVDDDRQRADGAQRLVRGHLRRPGQPHRAADLHVRHRGTEAEVPARAGRRRGHRRLLPERVGFRLRCPGRQDQGDAPGRRQLRALGREDVDHQRRLRRPLRRLRQGRRRAVHGVPGRARLAGRDLGQGRAQDGPPRLLDHAGDPPGREGARRCRARRGRQGPQGGLQRPQLRPLQARRDGPRRGPDHGRRRGEVRGLTPPVRRADRHLRRHQAQARRDDGARPTRSRA